MIVFIRDTIIRHTVTKQAVADIAYTTQVETVLEITMQLTVQQTIQQTARHMVEEPVRHTAVEPASHTMPHSAHIHSTVQQTRKQSVEFMEVEPVLDTMPQLVMHTMPQAVPPITLQVVQTTTTQTATLVLMPLCVECGLADTTVVEPLTQATQSMELEITNTPLAHTPLVAHATHNISVLFSQLPIP
jgi:hypothetical protein